MFPSCYRDNIRHVFRCRFSLIEKSDEYRHRHRFQWLQIASFRLHTGRLAAAFLSAEWLAWGQLLWSAIGQYINTRLKVHSVMRHCCQPVTSFIAWYRYHWWWLQPLLHNSLPPDTGDEGIFISSVSALSFFDDFFIFYIAVLASITTEKPPLPSPVISFSQGRNILQWIYQRFHHDCRRAFAWISWATLLFTPTDWGQRYR